LKKAIELINDLKKYQPIEATFIQDETGRITGGRFHYATAQSQYARGHIILKYNGQGKPAYTPEDVLMNGHFTLVGDEDFRENDVLAGIIGDHYLAAVANETLEEAGYATEFVYGENGAIEVTGIESTDVVVSNY